MPCDAAAPAVNSRQWVLQSNQAGFLDALVNLPGGYRTSRRELLKTGSLASGLACVYIALSRAKVTAQGFSSACALLRASMHTLSASGALVPRPAVHFCKSASIVRPAHQWLS